MPILHTCASCGQKQTVNQSVFNPPVARQPTSGAVQRTVAGIFGASLPLALGVAYDCHRAGAGMFPASELLYGAALLSVGLGLVSAATTSTAGDSFIRGGLLGTGARYVLKFEQANPADVYKGVGEVIAATPSKVAAFTLENAPWACAQLNYVQAESSRIISSVYNWAFPALRLEL